MTTTQTAPVPAREELSDRDVVQRIVGGDRALFEILMRRHNQQMYRIARAILRVDDEVEDVLQQAYLNAYEHLDQFADRSQFSTWLTRIVINEALATRRRRGTPFVQDEEGTMLRLADSKTPDPEQQAVSSELHRTMEDEVGSLSDALRIVFVMRDVEGLSTAETAACLGISEDLVKTRLHRARGILRDNLYRRAGVTAMNIFSFGNSRCDRLVERVMDQILKRG
jgi:RNA polymerase sigma-70 factor (ECF subfamily)